jgi:competence protein ComEA
MPEQPPSPHTALPPRQGVQYALVFLAGAAFALIGYRLVQGRITHPPESYRTDLSSTPSHTNETNDSRATKPLPTKRIDLNRAERHELLQLPGVGPSTADGILAYRNAKGPFLRIDDLRGVRGIGATTLEKLKPWLKVDDTENEEPLRLVRKNSEPTRSATGKKSELSAPLDLNKATAADLERLPGIGPTLAQRIVEEREKKPFPSVEDLKRVYGIGPKKLEQVKPFVMVRP